MADLEDSLKEEEIVQCSWEEKDTDLVVQYKADEKLNLPHQDELEL